MQDTTPRSVQSTVRFPWALRAAVDDVRMRRARRNGQLPATFNDIVVEAIERLIRQERREAGPGRRAARAAR